MKSSSQRPAGLSATVISGQLRDARSREPFSAPLVCRSRQFSFLQFRSCSSAVAVSRSRSCSSAVAVSHSLCCSSPAEPHDLNGAAVATRWPERRAIPKYSDHSLRQRSLLRVESHAASSCSPRFSQFTSAPSARTQFTELRRIRMPAGQLRLSLLAHPDSRMLRVGDGVAHAREHLAGTEHHAPHDEE